MKKTEKRKILIADDDASIVEALTMMLELENYSVEATDKHIFEKVIEVGPDLILLDVWLSGADGQDICKQLKGDRHTKDIPIIFVSACREIVRYYRVAGADDYLEKPFEMDQLFRKVHKYLPV